MTENRIQQIKNMLFGWNETDNYEEDYQKNCIVEELLTELQSLQAMPQSSAAG